MTEKKDPWWVRAQEVRRIIDDGTKWWNSPHQKERRALENRETLDPKIRYHTRLAALQNLPDPFVNSDAPENPLLAGVTPHNKDIEESELHELYETRLTPYQFAGRPEMIDAKDLNIGHKLHLNVGLEDVVAVSDYLKQEGFYHKFLSGGEVTDGTVFTVYVGSKDLTDKLARKLSQELKPYLKRPVRKDEVEYASNIPGRFVGDKKEFMQYGIGIRGLSIKREMAILFSPFADKTDIEKKKALAFKASFERLADKYGPYFYGSN